MSDKLKKILRTAGAFIFWVGLWALISYRINQSVLVPTPVEVIKRLSELLREKTFYITVGQSLLNIVSGFLLGTVFAIAAAVACHLSNVLDALIRPAMTVIKSTPVASFIILALVFIGKAFVPTLICFMMVTPVVFGAVTNGIELRDKELSEMLSVFRVNPVRKLFVFQIPSLIPFIGEGCSTALGLAWKAGIAAEVLCTPKNTIGIMLYESKVYLETVDVFCWTIVVVVLSLVLEAMLKAFLGKKRKEEKQSEKN